MEHLRLDVTDGIATLTLSRGKVNALHEPLVQDLAAALDRLADAADVRALILTGAGKFFSFGFDLPGFLNYSREEFGQFAEKFSRLCRRLFLYPKPVIAALNGHAVAGGCVLALPCDVRVMAADKAKIGLNEITFGSTVFGGIVEMLTHIVGARHAERVLLEGVFYSAAEALSLGLVDRAAPLEDVPAIAREVARTCAARDLTAYASLKRQLRRTAAENIARGEAAALTEFLDLWYSPSTREKLQGITIQS